MSVEMARAVLARYSDREGLTDADLASLRRDHRMSDRQVGALQRVLADGIISREEARSLIGSNGRFDWQSVSVQGRTPRLFSDEFVRTLAGNGYRPMLARTRRRFEAARRAAPEFSREPDYLLRESVQREVHELTRSLARVIEIVARYPPQSAADTAAGGNYEDYQALMELLSQMPQDTNPNVRLLVLNIAGRLGSLEAFAQLLSIVAGRSYSYRLPDSGWTLPEIAAIPGQSTLPDPFAPPYDLRLREVAVRILGFTEHATAVSILEQVMQTGGLPEQIQRSTVIALRDSHRDEALGVLISVVRTVSRSQLQSAAVYLDCQGLLSEASRRTLWSQIQSHIPDSPGTSAISALGQMRQDSAAHLLTLITSDPARPTYERAAALVALGHTRRSTAVSFLMRVASGETALNTGDRGFLQSYQEVPPPVIRFFSERRSSEAGEGISLQYREAAIRGLGYSGTRRAVEFLISFIEEGRRVPRPLRRAAILALGHTQHPLAVTYLTRLARGEGTPSLGREFRETAVAALGYSRHPAAVRALVGIVRDFPAMLGWTAISALGTTQLPQARRALREIASERRYSRRLRQAARDTRASAFDDQIIGDPQFSATSFGVERRPRRIGTGFPNCSSFFLRQLR